MNIEKMNKKQLEYLLYEESLDAVDSLRLYTCMKKEDFSKDDLLYAIDIIEDNIDDKSIEELEEIKKESLKYNCDIRIIDKYIKYLKGLEKKRKPKRKSVLGKILFWSLIDKLGNSNTSLFDEGYEDFNFEEEELEDDDFHFDDLD